MLRYVYEGNGEIHPRHECRGPLSQERIENIIQCVKNVCLIAMKENKNILSDIDEQIQLLNYRKNEIKKLLLLL